MIVDIHSHCWEFPAHFTEDFRRQAARARGDAQVDLTVTYEAYRAAAPDDTIAVVFGDTRLTYAELNARANQLARHLRRLGVGPEVTVPILCERSIELIVAILGIVKAGGAYAPLDPKYPADRIEWIFGEVRSPLILTHKPCADRIPSGADAVETGHDHPGDLRQGQQAYSDFRNGAQQTLRANKQCQQVAARAVQTLAANRQFLSGHGEDVEA